jgi:integrase
MSTTIESPPPLQAAYNRLSPEQQDRLFYAASELAERFQQLRKVLGHRKTTYERVFGYKSFYRSEFKPAIVRARIGDLVFHELRHTFATLALESGALDMFELSRALGHADYKTTDRTYAHLRKKDYSAHRTRFSQHIAAASPPAPIVALSG